MHRPAFFTFPDALLKRQVLVLLATAGAHLRRREPSFNLADLFAFFLSYMLKDRHKAAESKVADLPAPKLFHGSDVEIFDADRVYRLKSHRASLK